MFTCFRRLILHSSIAVLLCTIIPSSGMDDYCSLSQFSCLNGNCIPRQWHCDEEDDCKDNSDEFDCAPRSCNAADEFECSSGQCIPSRWQCDGEPDCADNSDESETVCRNITCRADHFSCGVAKPCIPSLWKCDGHMDCSNGRDEDSETCGTGTCKSDEFLCKNTKRCITQRWVCDMDHDCEDGSDEQDCGSVQCSTAQWQCANRHCVPSVWRCDGDSDCHDGSDELNCTEADTSAHHAGSHAPRNCAATEFQCTSGECIHEAWRCDSENDCLDGSDEKCDHIHTCSANEFQCRGSGRCIPAHQRCNGVPDCLDQSDESSCVAAAGRCDPETMFDCSAGSNEHCIPLSKVCDHHDDCGQFLDETTELCTNNTNPCLEHNGGCSDGCIFTYISHVCSCPSGYQLMSDGRTCEDVNECLVAGMCPQLCDNKKGGYKCSCLVGYEWDQADERCRATGDEPFLLFANRHDLREIRLYSGNYQMLVDGLKSVIALDFDFAEKILFWSDVATETISMTRLADNKTSSVNVLVHHDVSTPDGLAYDWVHKNLYWTDTGNNRIDVLVLSSAIGAFSGRSYSGRGRAMRKTLVNTNLDEPRAIVVDPRDNQRYLYWTDWGNSPKIERAYLDGDARTELITTNLQWPNGLTIDYESNLLFWVDAKLHHIACSDLTGSNQRIVMTSYQHLKHPFAITVFEDQVYWTDWEAESIFKVNKFKGHSTVKNVAMQLYSPMDIHVYHRLKQPIATNACEKAGCSHICLPRPKRAGGFVCACPDHEQTTYRLNENMKNCDIVSTNTDNGVKEPVTAKASSGGSAMSPQSRVKPMEPSVGHIAGAVVAILLMVALVLALVGVVGYRCYAHKKVRTLNFDNPVYRKTTEDHVSLEKNQYQPSRSLPPTLEPLTAGQSEYV